MKLSLRKANALQELIKEQLNEKVPTSISVGRFGDPLAAILEATNLLKNSIEKRKDLTALLYVLRQKNASAGAAVGIPDILTALARNQKVTVITNEFANMKEARPTDAVVLEAVADAKKQTPETRGYTYRENFTVPLLSKELIDAFKADLVLLRREKQELSDKLLHLNVSTTIELDKEEVAVLNKYSLL